MNAHAYSIRQQAMTALLAQLKERSPETQRCFFKNVKKLRKLFNRFVDEVADNSPALSKFQKEEYLKSLELRFRDLDFKYDPAYLESLFRQYGEDINRFPRIKDPELHAILCMNSRNIWNADTTPEKITQILNNKEIQKACLKLFYHLKLQKIRDFLQTSDPKAKAPKPRKEENEFRGTLVPKTESTTKFLQLLERDLIYFDDSGNGLKKEEVLESEKAELLTWISTLKENTFFELDQLLLFPKEESITYLGLLAKRLERAKTKLEKYEFDLLNFRDPAFMQPGMELQLKDRPDISEALHEVNAQRLASLTEILKKVQLRLQDYKELNKEKKSAARGEITPLQLVALLDTCGFFTNILLENKPDTKSAKMVSRIGNQDEQNVRKAIGNIQKKNPPKHIREARQWAEEVFEEIFG